ncbi:MAG: ParB/RepB/Spo0J family partition protein [Acidimicrobiales bacterium]
MARRSGLGRGLSALIPPEAGPTTAPVVDGPIQLVELPVASVEPNRNQPRQVFDEDSLASLTASIREVGVLQPVLVRPVDDDADRFELIAGERRWRAAHRAGLQTIPALVKMLDDPASLEQAVVENLHREDLNPLEEAAAYQQLIEEFALTHEQVAARVGRSRAAVTNALRLFQLPAGIQRFVADGLLSAGHAKALLGTPDRAFQEAIARRVVDEGLSVREVEDAIRSRGQQEAPATPETGATDGAGSTEPSAGRRRRHRDASLLELEELLGEFLETRVQISPGRGRGKLVIEFADLQDLERIYRRIASGPDDD